MKQSIQNLSLDDHLVLLHKLLGGTTDCTARGRFLTRLLLELCGGSTLPCPRGSSRQNESSISLTIDQTILHESEHNCRRSLSNHSPKGPVRMATISHHCTPNKHLVDCMIWASFISLWDRTTSLVNFVERPLRCTQYTGRLTGKCPSASLETAPGIDGRGRGSSSTPTVDARIQSSLPTSAAVRHTAPHRLGRWTVT